MRARRKALLGLVTSLGIVGGLEGGLRLARIRAIEARPPLPVEFVGVDLRSTPFPIVEDDDLFWRLRPGARVPGCADAINDQGYRGRRRIAPKPAGTKRVACLGDSCVFGFAVEVDATFPSRLERWLGWATGAPWEVLNAGVTGYTAWQMDRWLALHGADYRPDVLVVYAGAWNEYGPALGCDDETGAARIALSRKWRERVPVADLRLVRWMRSWLRPNERDDWVLRDARRKKYVELYSNGAATPDGPRLPPEAFRRILVSICRRAEDLGSAVVFVVPPAPLVTRQQFADGDAYAQIVRDVASEQRAGWADARAELASLRADRLLFADGIHPSERGHGVIARGVAAEIAELPVAGASPSSVPHFAAPLELHELVALARLDVGDLGPPRCGLPFTGSVPPGLFVPMPSRVTFPPIAIPPRASLLLQLGFPPVARGPQAQVPATFVVRAEVDGAKAPVLRARKKLAIGAQERWLVDLSAIGGSTVSLVLEVRGPQLWASWGQVELWSFRGL